MPFTATVLKIMIASPSDVSNERKIIHDVIHEWNAVNSLDRKVILQPVGWDTHATPQMGDRPQAIINKQVLNGCDLLIAVFWTRIGTSTKFAASGTVEEIEEHLKANGEALIYFSSAPVRLDSVEQDQYDALQAFKRVVSERGLIQQYEDLNSFKSLVSRQLAQTVIRMLSELNIPSMQVNSVRQIVLSAEAKKILFAAAKSSDGVIMHMHMLHGFMLQTNEEHFVETGDPRSEAQGIAAIKELIEAGLVEDRTGNGNVLNVTNSGYAEAAQLFL
jgi:hypothetical protein